MYKYLRQAAFLLGAVSCGANATSENPYEICYEDLKQYEQVYMSEAGYSNYSATERFDYLNSLKAPCRDLDLSIVYKADALLEMGKFDESIEELDRGISKGIPRIGNVVMAKANTLRKLKKVGVAVESSYSDIIELYKQALKLENTVQPLIHLGWAEAALLDGRLQEAMQHLEIGANLKPDISRFFSLGAVVTTKMEDYETTIRMIMIAIQKGDKNYFGEPDAVLAIATALCKLGRNDEAKPIVAQAQQMGGAEFIQHPDMVKAARMVLDCPAS